MIYSHTNQKSPRELYFKAAFIWIGKYWFQLVVSFFLVHIYANRNVQLIVKVPGVATSSMVTQETTTTIRHNPNDYQELSVGTSFIENKVPVADTKWKSSDFRNLSFILNPTLAERKKVDDFIVEEKLNNCRKYVKRFAKSAIVEMDKYGIPASITLAQGLLESDAGDSRLATESNNHFGIKCRSKCRGCTCRNYSDDDIYDMFRVFDSSWESFREHSLLLQIDRYVHLKKLGTKDYKNWAIGLKKAGYATDKNYHKKLIHIIEALDLSQFDK